ncbi:MAG: pyridoxal phosphate-dependent aminotransferase [Bacteroidales bacterium]|nr:pyridoxal phosphate-dependent aminotransferase [Bacteroidales bacterium]
MPSISQRGVIMPSSPIRKLVPYSDAAKARGIKVFHLNIGQPDILTPDVALAAVKNANIPIVEYTNSAGMPEYRRKLSKYYNSVGINIAPDEMLITCGGSEAVMFAFMSCLDPLDEIIVPEPFYANYEAFAAAAGALVKPITSTIETGFTLPSIDEFEKVITNKTKAIMICNPNNPTGYLYSEQEFAQLRDLIIKYDLFLIVDEVYREFCYDGATHYSSMYLKGVDENVIMIDSVSKRYSECGLRIGVLATHNKAVIASSMKLAQARLCPPTYGQIAAMASLDVPEEYFKAMNEEYRKRRNFLLDGLNKIPGVYSPMPRGAFYTVAKLPVDDSEKFCQWLLADFSYNNQTVMLAPAAGFYSNRTLGRNEVRIAYVLNCNDLAVALDLLARALKIYPGRTPESGSPLLEHEKRQLANN